MVRALILLGTLACLVLPSARMGQNGKIPQAPDRVSEADQQAVIQAIEDEIYDWGCQNDEVEFVGVRVAPEKYNLQVYINPQFNAGHGEIIYKFMPFGEIYRSFWIGKSGLAYLGDTPRQGFGPERPSHKTVFMDDDELCKDKQHWIRATFTIEEHPDKDRLRQARERQHKRMGEMDYGPYKDCPV